VSPLPPPELVWSQEPLDWTITFQLSGAGAPIAVVNLLAWPVMIYLWASSTRKIARVRVAVLDRYGLPHRLKWVVPLKQPNAFDRWLARQATPHR
jgi:hypothetical protein